MVDFSGLEAEDYAIKALLAAPGFEEDVISFRRKWHIPKSGFKNNKEKNEWWDGLSSVLRDKYRADLIALRIKYGRQENWHLPLHWYIQLNNPRLLRARSPWKITYKGDDFEDSKGEGAAEIKFTKGISPKDASNARRAFNKLSKAQKKQPPAEFDEHYWIYSEFLKRNKPVAEFVEWWNEHHARTPDEVKTTDSIRKIIDRMESWLSPGQRSND